MATLQYASCTRSDAGCAPLAAITRGCEVRNLAFTGSFLECGALPDSATVACGTGDENEAEYEAKNTAEGEAIVGPLDTLAICAGLGKLSSNPTSRGAREIPAAQAIANPVTSSTAGFQLGRGARDRSASRICATRNEVCRMRPKAACASAKLRRTKLFSARCVKHSA